MAKPSGRRTSQFKLQQGQPQPTKFSAQNNFTKGLLTEFSGLNFPENACTETSNCVFKRTGSVVRRSGLDYETNFALNDIDRTEKAISSYRWLNAGGDGETQIYVLQVGATLYFFESSAATTFSPLSAQKLSSTVNLDSFSVSSSTSAVECQYADGNGYLFVYNTNMDPIYCTLSAGVITANKIGIKVRDFVGNVEVNVADNLRPSILSIAHNYNLQNQGWTEGAKWATTSSTGQIYNATVPVLWNFYGVASGLIAQAGDIVRVDSGGYGQIQNSGGSFPAGLDFLGIVVNYNSAGGSMSINITENLTPSWSDAIMVQTGSRWASENITFNIYTAPTNDKINTWHTAIGNYPSNADVWWQFKDSSQVFNPAVTIGNVTLNSGPAPKGYYILDAFNQDRSAASGVAGINPVTTTKRPKTGCWFQGRVWYTGVDASVTQQDLISSPSNTIFYTWTESIYFSQIVTNTSQFGKCHQKDDPTSEDLFDLLPSDGGVIQIQGCGSIYKLFPIQTGVLVFAANGVWYITGSAGLGFTANDYAITKVSGVESISSTSYVNVQGLPIFWNEEGIYAVQPTAQNQRNNEQLGLSVNPITLTTIKSFYDSIPVSSKKYARGYYNPITDIIQWVYKSTEATDVTSRYQFDSILNLNILIQAFYPWTISAGPYIHDVTYIAGPGGSSSPDPVFKYLTSDKTTHPIPYSFTFSEEKDIGFVDWASSGTSVNYVSDFTTGYALHGDAIRKWQPEYVLVYQNLTPPPTPGPTHGPPLFLVWDNGGNLYSSKDLGVTWSVNSTPNGADTWNDVVMATNAGDFKTMVGFDNNWELGSAEATAFSSTVGQTGSWTIGFPNIANVSTFGCSGAVNAKGTKIIALPSSFLSDPLQSFPQLSTNQGASWSTLSVPSGRWWNVACMDSTATNIYMVWIMPDGSSGGISKSSDGGLTWTDLAASFDVVAYYDSYCAQRIRCSADGQTFIHATTQTDSVDLFGSGFAFVSTDGGVTITTLTESNFPGAHFTRRTCSDCSVSDDGKTMLVAFGSTFSFRCYLALSKDSGVTWVQLTPPNFLNDPVNSGHALQTAFLSPDGQNIIAAYQDTDGVGDYLVDISTDQGVTWTSSTIVPSFPGDTPVTSFAVFQQ